MKKCPKLRIEVDAAVRLLREQVNLRPISEIRFHGLPGPLNSLQSIGMTSRSHRPARTIRLTEYAPALLPQTMLPPAQGERWWRMFDQNGRFLTITFPSPKTDDQWQLVSNGWVGVIRPDMETQLLLEPRIPIHNLFHMWRLAYGLDVAAFHDGLGETATIADFFATAALLLAQRTLRRIRSGLVRQYETRREQLPFVRGRLLIAPQPDPRRLLCEFHAATTDYPDNQILAYTLNHVARHLPLDGPAQAVIRQAYHAINGFATAVPFPPSACSNRLYTRLNHDYQLLHALCRFLLTGMTPIPAVGQTAVPAFLMHLPRLFEQYVAAWLQQQLPAPWQLRIQERVPLGPQSDLQLAIDMVVYDEAGRPFLVLDTKYKSTPKPEAADIQQIVTYAEAKQCPQAILVYPQPLAAPLDLQVGKIRVRTLHFALDAPAAAAGAAFLQRLLPATTPS